MSDVTYIRITTTSGVASGDSGSWIPVSDLDLTTQNSGVGTNASGALSFTLSDDDGIASTLDQAVDAGSTFTIEVATYANSTPSGTLLSYAKSTGALATLQTSSAATNANNYTLSLANISQTTYPNGVTSASGFNYTEHKGTMAAAPPANVQTVGALSTSTAPDPSGLTYYAQFATAQGTYLENAGGGTWFALSNVSGGLSNENAGAVSFLPLSFKLTDVAGEGQLLKDAFTGTHLYGIQVEAMSGSTIVDNTTYETAAISSETNGGDVSIQYAAYYHQHFAANGQVTTDGWNQTRKMADTGGSAIAKATPTKVSAGQPTTGYFLQVSGLTGDTASPGGGSATGFVPSSASFSVATTPSTSGSGAGKVSVSDLDLTSSSQVLGLHADTVIFTGGVDKTFALTSYYDSRAIGTDTFKNVVAASDGIDLVSGTRTLEFAFTQVVDQYATNSSGTSFSTSSFDLTTTKSDAIVQRAAVASDPTPTAATTSSSTSTGSVHSNAVAAASAPANTSYIQFRNADGTVVTSSSGQSWFALDSASTGFQQTVAYGGGAQANSVSLSDLGFVIGQDAISGTLDNDLVAGTKLTAEVATYSGSSGALQSDYVFGNGTINSHQASPGSSAQSFGFSETNFQETQYSSGSSIGTVTYDTATNTGGTVATQAIDAPSTAPMTTNAAPQAVTTYVQFVGGDGVPLTGSNGSSWFEVAGTSSGLSAVTNPSTGARPTDLGDLGLSLGDDPVTSQLDADYFNESTLSSINVETYNPDGTLESTQSYGTATVAGTGVTNTGDDHGYDFSYTGYGETIQPTGTGLSTPSSATAGTTTTAPLPVPTADIGADSAPSLSTLSFYAELKTQAGGDELFAGTSSGFVALPSVTISLSGPSASFEVDQAQAAVLAATLDNKTAAQLEVAGYNSSGRSIDYVLSGVSLLSSSVDAATGLDMVQLQYAGLQETKTDGSTVTYGPAGTQRVDAPADAPPAVCFAAGTLIRTSRGDVAVEHLRVGDFVVTAAGDRRPIRWIGHRTTDPRCHPRPHEAQPIRITAHALAPNRPARDLFVSPGHAICVDVLGEVLIPAIALVDGSTVQQVEVDTVTYWHIELEEHDILLAENLPAESYIDCGNRAFFVEAGVVDLAAHPDARHATTADYCRPFHADGQIVEAVRAQLHARAAALGRRQSPLQVAS